MYGTAVPANSHEKLVLSQDVRSGQMVRHTSQQNAPVPNIAKIMFFRDEDTLYHPMEKMMGRWVVDFHEKVARYCSERPRYTELRPFHFSQAAHYFPHADKMNAETKEIIH